MSEAYLVTINYSHSLAAMIKAGKYELVSNDLTTKLFPVVGTGVVERTQKLYHFGRLVGDNEATQLIAADGFERSPIEDQLAFGARYPDEQRKYPIAGRTYAAEVRGHRRVPYLFEGYSRRNLYLYCNDFRWSDGCRFLARKVSAA